MSNISCVDLKWDPPVRSFLFGLILFLLLHNPITALTEGLNRDLSKADFDEMLGASIGDIFGASKAGPYLLPSESNECHESSFHTKCPLMHV